MTAHQKHAGRPPGAKNLRPSRDDVSRYMALLRDAADQGDPNACKHLIDLHHREAKQ